MGSTPSSHTFLNDFMGDKKYEPPAEPLNDRCNQCRHNMESEAHRNTIKGNNSLKTDFNNLWDTDWGLNLLEPKQKPAQTRTKHEIRYVNLRERPKSRRHQIQVSNRASVAMSVAEGGDHHKFTHDKKFKCIKSKVVVNKSYVAIPKMSCVFKKEKPQMKKAPVNLENLQFLLPKHKSNHPKVVYLKQSSRMLVWKNNLAFDTKPQFMRMGKVTLQNRWDAMENSSRAHMPLKYFKTQNLAV